MSACAADTRGGSLARLLDIRPDERAAAAWSFVYFFTLLCGYYILRPLRELGAFTRWRLTRDPDFAGVLANPAVASLLNA